VRSDLDYMLRNVLTEELMLSGGLNDEESPI
jgi:hypothetical protein